MTTPPLLTYLSTLAQAQPAQPVIARPSIDEIQSHLSSDGLIPTHWILIAAGGLIVLLSGLSVARWWKHRHEHSHPLLVFSTTASLVGLRYRDQWTLVLLAYNQSLASPLTLMLSQDTFDHHAKAYLESRRNWRRETVRRQLNEIRTTLFDDQPAHLPTQHAPA